MSPPDRHERSSLLFILYVVASFTASALIFVLEPMFGKMLLPTLGGTPGVWITCVLFFQVSMLLGYSYAHWSAVHLGPRKSWLHVLLFTVSLLFLPVALPAALKPPVQHTPILWVLAIASVSIGVPFTLLCTMGPTLQRWYSALRQPDSRDPYFLYSASNLGSMLGLLAYPILIEPHLTLRTQSRAWTATYGAFIVVAAACAWSVRHRQPAYDRAQQPSTETSVRFREAVRWIVLASVPSSLMLGLTTYLATDIPPVPLLLVVPIALYLGTFILVFARKQLIRPDFLADRLPFVILVTVITMFLKVTGPLFFVILLHLITFFVTAMVCHGELARSRPSTQRLTAFYLCISLGGVLGGTFNAVVAPLLFRNVIEYPLALVAAMLIRPSNPAARQNLKRDLIWPLGLAAMMIGITAICRSTAVPAGAVRNLIIIGPAALICLSFSRRPIRFALGIAAIFAVGFYSPFTHVLKSERSFFGVYRVIDDPSRHLHLFMHGSTLHGAQSTDLERRRDMLTYFAPTGPLGQIYATVYAHNPVPRVGIIGLGAGTLACYGRDKQSYTYYEIDPTVEHIARDTRYFTFLRDCPPRVKVILGDARLSLAQTPRQHFNLLVLDAFSSDVIPIHLLTREALQLYLENLDPHGVIAINISNRYLDLGPVVDNLARDAGLISLQRQDASVTQKEQRDGKMASRWVILAREPNDIRELLSDARWEPPAERPGMRVWSDDFSNIFSVIRFD